MSAVLEVSGLGKRFGELQALSEIDLELGGGEVLAVIGPNGAGKTTLLSIIAGVQTASAGTVGLHAHEIGWAPQQAALYSKLSVAENLELFARLQKVPDPAAAVARMLEQTGLRERADEPVGRLSGGNRQRVNVALALISDPPVLALDEPSAALDPAQRERLWEFISQLAGGGTTVLFSTHSMSEASRHATRVLLLADGRTLFDGPPADLIERSPAPPGADLEQAVVAFLREHTPAAAADQR